MRGGCGRPGGGGGWCPGGVRGEGFARANPTGGIAVAFDVVAGGICWTPTGGIAFALTICFAFAVGICWTVGVCFAFAVGTT